MAKSQMWMEGVQIRKGTKERYKEEYSTSELDEESRRDERGKK